MGHFTSECPKNEKEREKQDDDKEVIAEEKSFVVIWEEAFEDEDEFTFHQATNHVNLGSSSYWIQ
jgi:hypothetical protein